MTTDPCSSSVAIVLATLRREQCTVLSRAGIPPAWLTSREGQRYTTRIHAHGITPGRSILADFRHHPADQVRKWRALSPAPWHNHSGTRGGTPPLSRGERSSCTVHTAIFQERHGHGNLGVLSGGRSASSSFSLYLACLALRLT